VLNVNKGGGRKVGQPMMEIRLNEWYQDQRKQGALITCADIKEKARELSEYDHFLASKGWFDKFKFRYNIQTDKDPNK
jgi:hypothetical protein